MPKRLLRILKEALGLAVENILVEAKGQVHTQQVHTKYVVLPLDISPYGFSLGIPLGI